METRQYDDHVKGTIDTIPVSERSLETERVDSETDKSNKFTGKRGEFPELPSNARNMSLVTLKKPPIHSSKKDKSSLKQQSKLGSMVSLKRSVDVIGTPGQMGGPYPNIDSAESYDLINFTNKRNSSALKNVNSMSHIASTAAGRSNS